MRRHRRSWLVPFAALAVAALACASSPAKRLKHPIEEAPTARAAGPYRAALLATLRAWPKQALPPQKPAQDKPAPRVRLVPYETPDHGGAIGLGQGMTIVAPLAAARGVLEDFAHYKDLFFAFKDVQLKESDGNRFVTFWEESIPLPFVPSSKYSTYFYVDDTRAGHVFYRYELKDGTDLKYSDGIIVLDSIDDKTTAYTEYDFFDADWGVAETLAPARIWRDSVRDIYYSDIAIKLKAEHPDWEYRRVREESKQAWSEDYPDDALTDLLAHKNRFP